MLGSGSKKPGYWKTDGESDVTADSARKQLRACEGWKLRVDRLHQVWMVEQGMDKSDNGHI